MAKFYKLEDVVDSLCLISGDVLKKNKGLYSSVAKDVWNDLNEGSLRIATRIKLPVRKLFEINKRTHSIELPCDALRISSVSVVDKCGVIYPVYRNMNLHNDIVDVPASKNCACEFNCGNQLCNLIKGYEAVIQDIIATNPDGSSTTFHCVSRMAIDKNGVLWQENQYPQRAYTNGVWTSTVLHTESKKLCECEIDSNGCICDTVNNVNNICSHCGITNNINNCFQNNTPCVGGTAMTPPQNNCGEWIYYCDNKMDWFTIQCGCHPMGFRQGCNNIYNIGETGDRLVFPHNFGFDHALVRYYVDINLSDLMIPYYARNTFQAGIMCYATEYNENKIKVSRAFCQDYSRKKWGLFLDLQRMRTSELAQIISPRAHVPSYVESRVFDSWFGWR